ncbi:hypothetical protein IAU60_004974 [Kwoniella sp. DSM 27419]
MAVLLVSAAVKGYKAYKKNQDKREARPEPYEDSRSVPQPSGSAYGYRNEKEASASPPPYDEVKPSNYDSPYDGVPQNRGGFGVPVGVAPGEVESNRLRPVRSNSSSSSESSVSSKELSRRNPHMSRSDIKALRRAQKYDRKARKEQRKADRKASKAQYRADKAALKVQQNEELARLARSGREQGERMRLDPGYMAKDFGDRGLALGGRDFAPTFGKR